MKNKSFTLIELLVVIVIIGILAGVIVVSTFSSINKANIAKSKVFSEGIKNDLMLDLISEYKFNEGSGTIAKDSWGASGNGILDCYGSGCQNPEWSSDCVSGKCLEFYKLDNSVGSRVMITQNDSINLKENQPFTIEYWIKLKSIPSGTYFSTVMKGTYGTSYGHLVNGFNLRVYTDDDADAELTVSNFFSNQDLNRWIHVVQIFDGEQIIVYKNSQTNENYKSVSGITLTINASSLVIGSSGTNYFLNGFIDDIRIYNAAFSSSQIKQQYIAGLNSLLAKGSISEKEYEQGLNNLAYEK